MEIAYVRTYEAYDRCHVVRADGSEDAFRFHAYGGALPHDLVHYAVEAAFGLQRAVWGSVAAGLDLARANQHANRKGGTDKWRDAWPLSESLRGASPRGDTRTSDRAAAGSQSDRQRGR